MTVGLSSIECELLKFFFFVLLRLESSYLGAFLEMSYLQWTSQVDIWINKFVTNIHEICTSANCTFDEAQTQKSFLQIDELLQFVSIT